MRHHAVAATLLTATLLVTGCTAENSAENTAKTATETTATTTQEDTTRLLTDIDGTDVRVPKQVTRMADTWDVNNQFVLMLGGGDTLVATTEEAKRLPWLTKIYPHVTELPTPASGTRLNVEELKEINPEMLLTSSKEQVEAARAQGIPAARVDFDDFEQLMKSVRITANALGTEEADQKATEYVTYMERNLKMVADRLGGMPGEKKPKVLHIVGGEDVTQADGPDSLVGEWIAGTGARNVIEEVVDVTTVTPQDIVDAAPDFIIVGGTEAQLGVDKLVNDPALANVPAVKQGNVVKNPVGTSNWGRYSAEEALQLLWAAKLFHTEKFEDVDLVAETQQFYKTFYDYELSTEDAQRILDGEGPAA